MKLIEKKSVVPLPEIVGSISDTTNIEDKTTNTYSARIIDEMAGLEIIENENGTAYKYTDGRLECMGEGECPANVNYADITFPFPFVDMNYRMFAGHKYSGDDNYGGSYQLTSITTPQPYTIDKAYIYSYLYNGIATYPRKVQYFAIGRWK